MLNEDDQNALKNSCAYSVAFNAIADSNSVKTLYLDESVKGVRDVLSRRCNYRTAIW